MIGLGASALARPRIGLAQAPPARSFRIGFLGTGSASTDARRVEALRAGLRDLGYVDGKNIVIEFRWADGRNERLPQLAAELAQLKIDALVTYGTPGIRAAKQATTAIPIVMAIAGDAVEYGLVTSLARPEANVTGTTVFSPEISAKRLDLLMEVVPRARRIAALLNPENPAQHHIGRAMALAAESRRMDLRRFEARDPNECENAFTAMAKSAVDAVVIPDDYMFIANARLLADLARKQRLPSSGFRDFAEGGGVLGYGVNVLDVFRRSAYVVDKILKGAKPADLPVEQPTKFELVINLKTAKALGLTIPPSLLARADQVIE
jgi:putative ABC transport system substrate-binding protein